LTSTRRKREASVLCSDATGQALSGLRIIGLAPGLGPGAKEEQSIMVYSRASLPRRFVVAALLGAAVAAAAASLVWASHALSVSAPVRLPSFVERTVPSSGASGESLKSAPRAAPSHSPDASALPFGNPGVRDEGHAGNGPAFMDPSRPGSVTDQLPPGPTLRGKGDLGN